VQQVADSPLLGKYVYAMQKRLCDEVCHSRRKHVRPTVNLFLSLILNAVAYRFPGAKWHGTCADRRGYSALYPRSSATTRCRNGTRRVSDQIRCFAHGVKYHASSGQLHEKWVFLEYWIGSGQQIADLYET
jgi:hypothetical protein